MPLEEKLHLSLPSLLEKIILNGTEVLVKRDDLIHPIISGNKWRKLKGFIEAYRNSPHCKGIVSMGGAFSNHLHALGYICNKLNIPLKVIVRGEDDSSNPLFTDLRRWETKLIFKTRREYRKLRIHDYHITDDNDMFIPEGGRGKPSLNGIQELYTELPIKENTTIVIPAGSGATALGLAQAAEAKVRMLVVPVLKSSEFASKLKNELNKLHIDHRILTDNHFGGFASHNVTLLQYINQMYQTHQIPLEPIYSAKMFYALTVGREINKLEGQIIIIHTGGLQGVRGFNYRYNKYLAWQ